MAMRRLLWSVLAILFILQVADVVTSNAVLASQVGAWEVNPVMRGAMEHFGSLWWLPKAAFGIVVILLASMLSRVSRRTMVAAVPVTRRYGLRILHKPPC